MNRIARVDVLAWHCEFQKGSPLESKGRSLTTVQYGTEESESVVPRPTHWHVIWTHSNCEMAVYEQLTAKGYELFPALAEQRVAGKPTRRVPLFRSYVFLRHHVDKYDYLDICSTKGLVSILGDRWDRLGCIPDAEINTIKRLCESGEPVRPYPWLKTGDRVRITRGPLVSMTGLFVRTDEAEGLFIVSVTLLNRSVAIKVAYEDAVPE